MYSVASQHARKALLILIKFKSKVKKHILYKDIKKSFFPSTLRMKLRHDILYMSNRPKCSSRKITYSDKI